MKTKTLENNIVNNYYNISLFINKYITIIIGFLIASILFIGAQNNNYNIVKYSKNDVLNNINNNIIIGKNTTNFNKNNIIKSNLIITNSNISGNITNLGVGIFKTKKDNIILPINSEIKINKNNTIFKKTYIINLKNSKLIKNKFKISNKKLINTNELIKKYNLGCTKTYLNNTIFCKINKENVIKDILIGKIELSKKAYKYLFDKINNNNKCNILVKIFNKKYNLSNINLAAEKYCSNEIYNNMLNTIDIYKYVISNLFGKDISTNSDINIIKLVKQEQILLIEIKNKKDISKNNLIMYITLIKNIINSGGISQNNAIFTKNILNIIKKYIKSKNVDLYNLTKKDINKIIIGDNLGNKGLNNFIKEKIRDNTTSDYNKIEIVKHTIISNKEKIKNIFDKYNNIFTLMNNIKQDKNKKIYHIEGLLILNFKGKKTKQIDIKMDIQNIIGTNFKMSNIQLKNNKLQKYITDKGYLLDNIDSLIKLKEKLEEILYNPIVLNDYGKTKKVSLCDKINSIVKSIKGTCNNGIIKANIKDKNIVGDLNITFKINKSLNISDIELNNYNINYKNKAITLDFKKGKINDKEILTLNLDKSKKIFQKLIGDSISIAPKIISLEKKLILKEKENYENKLTNLSNNELIKINNDIKSKLGGKIQLIRYMKGNNYKIYFTKDGILFLGLFDNNKNIINNLIILIPKKNKYFIFKNVNLSLSKLNNVNTNNFKFDTKKFLKKINSEKYNEYIQFIQKK